MRKLFLTSGKYWQMHILWYCVLDYNVKAVATGFHGPYVQNGGHNTYSLFCRGFTVGSPQT